MRRRDALRLIAGLPVVGPAAVKAAVAAPTFRSFTWNFKFQVSEWQLRILNGHLTEEQIQRILGGGR